MLRSMHPESIPTVSQSMIFCVAYHLVSIIYQVCILIIVVHNEQSVCEKVVLHKLIFSCLFLFILHRTNLQPSPEGCVGGEEIISYMPPLPYQGTGYHRYIFILYRQDRGQVNLDNWRRGEPSRSCYRKNKLPSGLLALPKVFVLNCGRAYCITLLSFNYAKKTS
ncbi:unnamed protein product [Trichobilharzia regenti]|nr:unnamed protein product [Trichobilharzia regenti]